MTEQATQGQAEEAPAVEVPDRVPLSRREFLYYLWGISMAVFMAGSGGAMVWFSLPIFREGEFGGVFVVPIGEIPAPDSVPRKFPEGGFWLANVGPMTVADPRQPDDYPLEEGVRAFYKVCTHLGCLYKWVATYDQFECPCHGSKFLKTGARIDGPARRNLDVFPIEVLDADGVVLARTEPSMNKQEGTAIQPPQGGVSLRIDTGRRIVGALNSKRGGGM